MSETHYTSNLYPLQDKVLQLFAEAKVKHYLTGGTALSRFYFQHRYSDDLDFFLNYDKEFEKESDRAIQLLLDTFTNVNVDNKQEFYRRVFVTEGETKLKLDFVNDVGFHVGLFEDTSLYYKVDNILNITSNKITALSRNSAKDIADIIWICKNVSFNWIEIIEQAKQKDDWVNEVDVLARIKTFPIEALVKDVVWIHPPEIKILEDALKIICHDIAAGIQNSLYQSK